MAFPSNTAGFHAEADGAPVNSTSSVFTQWGGYQSAFPEGGYVTALDVYLDFPPPAGSSLTNDMRFDWASAINKPDGTHRRDFVFNVGYYDDTDTTGSGPRYVMTASNNATRSSAFPKNPARDPFAITAEGWYTFEHQFNDIGGVLSVTLTVRSPVGAPLHTWTLSDPTDIIGTTVGGNRYGWVVINEFDFLALDNSMKEEVDPEDAVDHFACYDVQELTRFQQRTVVLDDQFGPPDSMKVRKAETLCAPVNKNGEGINFEDFHLVCYDVNENDSANTTVEVTNQFGVQKLRVRNRQVLCVPSTKDVVSTGPGHGHGHQGTPWWWHRHH